MLLTVDRKGFIHWGDLRLPVRYEHGALEFVVKHPRDRERLGCNRIKIPLDAFKTLERARCASISIGADSDDTGDEKKQRLAVGKMGRNA